MNATSRKRFQTCYHKGESEGRQIAKQIQSPIAALIRHKENGVGRTEPHLHARPFLIRHCRCSRSGFTSYCCPLSRPLSRCVFSNESLRRVEPAAKIKHRIGKKVCRGNIPDPELLLIPPTEQACHIRGSIPAPALSQREVGNVQPKQPPLTVFKRREMSSAMRSVDGPRSAFSTKLQCPLEEHRHR